MLSSSLSHSETICSTWLINWWVCTKLMIRQSLFNSFLRNLGNYKKAKKTSIGINDLTSFILKFYIYILFKE